MAHLDINPFDECNGTFEESPVAPMTLLDVHDYDDYMQAVEARDTDMKAFCYANIDEVVYHPHEMNYDYKHMTILELLDHVARGIFGSFYPVKEA